MNLRKIRQKRTSPTNLVWECLNIWLRWVCLTNKPAAVSGGTLELYETHKDFSRPDLRWNCWNGAMKPASFIISIGMNRTAKSVDLSVMTQETITAHWVWSASYWMQKSPEKLCIDRFGILLSPFPSIPCCLISPSHQSSHNEQNPPGPGDSRFQGSFRWQTAGLHVIIY